MSKIITVRAQVELSEAAIESELVFYSLSSADKIGFYFFTYECCRRRLPLIKMINGVEEVLILLFTAFGYEYLF